MTYCLRKDVVPSTPQNGQSLHIQVQLNQKTNVRSVQPQSLGIGYTYDTWTSLNASELIVTLKRLSRVCLSLENRGISSSDQTYAERDGGRDGNGDSDKSRERERRRSNS